MKALGQLLGRAFVAWSVMCFLLGAFVPQAAWCTPMVSISRPHAGDAVGAQLSVSASYQSSSPSESVVKLELLIDSQVVAAYPLSVPQEKGEHVFSYNLQSTTGQTRQVSVRAIDNTGGVGEAIIKVTVRQISAPVAATGEDRTPPVVNVYYPAPGQHVAGTISIKADVQDNVGVSWVFFYLDGKMKAMANRPPFTDDWDTTRMSDGEHVLQARAWDAAENEGRSAEVHVVVGNRDMTTIQRPAASAGASPAVMTVTPPGKPAATVEAPIIPAPGPTRERAALPVPAPVVHQTQPAAPPVVGSATTATARRATAAASGTRVAALPKTSTVTGGRPSRVAIGETIATTDSALGMFSAAPSWDRVAVKTAPRAEGVQIAYQVSTPLGTVARAMGEAATMACAPVDATTAPSARPAVSAPVGADPVQSMDRPAREASAVVPAEALLSPAELALAPGATVVYVTALMPPMPGTLHEASPAPTVEPQGVSLDAATEVVKGVRVGSLGKILASSGGVLTWYAAEKRMHCVTPQVTMDLRLGQTMARVNGEARTLEVAPFVHNGEAMVPLSFLADALGLTITFDATHGRLIISSKAK